MDASTHNTSASSRFSREDSVLAIALKAGVPEVPAAEDDDSRLTIFPHGSGSFEVSASGVRFVGGGGSSNRVCDELRVVAKTRNAAGGSWGRRLYWRDADGKPHYWSMPMEMLQGDSSEVLKELAAGGLGIVAGQQRRLCEYLQAFDTDARVRCVDRLGWHGAVYVTPDETVGGDSRESVVFQGAASVLSEHRQAGTAQSWRHNVAALAAGNSRLLFALCCAFAGPLLEPAGVESGGFHFLGPSSSGKTTALHLAASVWGWPECYVRQWRATANGLEGLASIHNDGLLILDELSQCDPKQAGEAAYMLANGKGKARASRNGSAKEAASWRALFLSSGEQSLAGLMESAAKRANAGQELRLANVASEAGAGLGIFEALHGYASPGVYAQTVKDACAAHHGSVGRTWLRCIVKDRDRLANIIADGIADFIAEAVPAGASGQAQRVARRFGLVATAGELATHYGLTSWAEGEAANGVRKCYEAWLEGYGPGSLEDKAIREMVRLYLVKHGSSRFQSIEAPALAVPNRAGFWREGAHGLREYLVPTSTFKAEVVPGCDVKRAVQALKDAGMLIPGSDKNSISVRLPELGQSRVYCLTIREEVETCA